MSLKCCLCGHRFETGEIYVEIKVLRLMAFKESGKPFGAPEKMEDGTDSKVACYTCPVKAGAPMSLIGADPNERTDV